MYINIIRVFFIVVMQRRVKGVWERRKLGFGRFLILKTVLLGTIFENIGNTLSAFFENYFYILNLVFCFPFL